MMICSKEMLLQVFIVGILLGFCGKGLVITAKELLREFFSMLKLLKKQKNKKRIYRTSETLRRGQIEYRRPA